MPDDPQDQYKFGPFVLDPQQKILTRAGEVVHLSPKAFEILTCLVRNSNRVVRKEELIKEVWPDSFVEDANLTVHISALRKILNGDSTAASIETFPKVGYKLVADVEIFEAGPTAEKKNGATPNGSPPKVTEETGGRKFQVAVAVFLAVIVLVIAVLGVRYFTGGHSPTPQQVRVQGTENSSTIALSPNGEYIAHTVSKFGKRALTVTNIGSGSSVQLTPPSDALYFGLKFTPDSSFIYFVRFENDELVLNKLPVLGGTVTPVLHNAGETLSFSPDGSKFCFVRHPPNTSTAIFVANADGTETKEIAHASGSIRYSPYDLDWSPDGQTIAVLVHDGQGEADAHFVGINVETGQQTSLSSSAWAAGDGIAWLPDGKALVAGLIKKAGVPTQVWLVPTDGAEPRAITSDLENYGSIDVSADGQTLMAGQFKDESALWVQPQGQPTESRPVTDEKHHNFNWVRWAGDSHLVFGSSVTSNRDVWMMDVDGSNEKQITANVKNNVMPVASSDGSAVFFCSNRAGGGFNIFRSDADGQNVAQLTFGNAASQLAISPDDTWIYFTATDPDSDPLTRTLWKVPAAGGNAVQFIKQPAYAAAISPDGNSIAAWIKPADDRPWQVAIMRSSDGSIIKFLDIPKTNSLKWTADGRGISYIRNIDGVSNIWTQPINGGTPVQETKFNSDNILNFDWSRTGVLVCSRSERSRDVVLIRNFR